MCPKGKQTSAAAIGSPGRCFSLKRDEEAGNIDGYGNLMAYCSPRECDLQPPDRFVMSSLVLFDGSEGCIRNRRGAACSGEEERHEESPQPLPSSILGRYVTVKRYEKI